MAQGTGDSKRRRGPPPSAAQIRGILERLAQGQSVRAAAKAEGVAVSTAVQRLWSEKWHDHYARARELGAEVIAARVLDTAELVMAGRLKPEEARVAIDAFKWVAGKQMPKRYAEPAGQRVAIQGEQAAGSQGGFSFRIDLTPALPAEADGG